MTYINACTLHVVGSTMLNQFPRIQNTLSWRLGAAAFCVYPHHARCCLLFFCDLISIVCVLRVCDHAAMSPNQQRSLHVQLPDVMIVNNIEDGTFVCGKDCDNYLLKTVSPTTYILHDSFGCGRVLPCSDHRQAC